MFLNKQKSHLFRNKFRAERIPFEIEAAFSDSVTVHIKQRIYFPTASITFPSQTASSSPSHIKAFDLMEVLTTGSSGNVQEALRRLGYWKV